MRRAGKLLLSCHTSCHSCHARRWSAGSGRPGTSGPGCGVTGPGRGDSPSTGSQSTGDMQDRLFCDL